VIRAAHALAAHRPVELWVRPTGPTTSASILASMGLSERRTLRLGVLPASSTAASVAHRLAMARFAARHRGRALWLSRSPRYARQALRLGGQLVVEAHGLHEPADLEAWGLRRAAGLITNSVGTRQRLEQRHRALPPTVTLANACRGPGPALHGPGHGVGYVGSLRDDKGVDVLARLAVDWPEPVVVVTPEAQRARALSRRWQVEPALPPAEVPARLARFRALVLCLAHGPFGDLETCPLKWFDYQASGRPVVVADTPAIRALVPDWVPRFAPGDEGALRQALHEALAPRRVARFAAREGLRTWADRAAEVDAFLQQVAP
jgi:glycosyltransferase involved in cell wall biosynthesis